MARIAEMFAERSTRGLFVRWVGSVVCVGLPVIAARVWWSPVAAIIVFVVAVIAYVTLALRYKRRHSPPA